MQSLDGHKLKSHSPKKAVSEAPCLGPPPTLPRLAGVRESQGSQGGPRPRLTGEHLGHHPPSSAFHHLFRRRFEFEKN